MKKLTTLLTVTALCLCAPLSAVGSEYLHSPGHTPYPRSVASSVAVSTLTPTPSNTSTPQIIEGPGGSTDLVDSPESTVHTLLACLHNVTAPIANEQSTPNAQKSSTEHNNKEVQCIGCQWLGNLLTRCSRCVKTLDDARQSAARHILTISDLPNLHQEASMGNNHQQSQQFTHAPADTSADTPDSSGDDFTKRRRRMFSSTDPMKHAPSPNGSSSWASSTTSADSSGGSAASPTTSLLRQALQNYSFPPQSKPGE